MTDTTISRMWIMRWRPTSRSALLEGKIGRDELGNTQRHIMGGALLRVIRSRTRPRRL